MAKETQTQPAAETPTAPTNNKGKTFVKWRTLAGPQDAKITRVGPGSFGKTDLEWVAGTRTLIVSVSPKSPQYEALINAFGPPEAWVGCVVRVADDTVMRAVNVTPLLDRQGRRVQA